jgi:hypothetical protein
VGPASTRIPFSGRVAARRLPRICHITKLSQPRWDGASFRHGRRAATNSKGTRGSLMARLSFIVLLLLLGGLAAGGVFLMTWDIPAPQNKVEKVIPNERFEP